MSGTTAPSKRILILQYSFSAQTRNLVRSMVEGLEEYPVALFRERLTPVEEQHFPIGTVPKTLKKMIVTLFRQRVPIQPLSPQCFEEYDLIILAGPTWSYNPSGPVLSLLDRDGEQLFHNQVAIPVISCRGFWRMHWWGIRSLLKGLGATVPNGIIFSHPNKEPWCTIGVFLKLAGKVPEKMSWMRPHYKKYGHTTIQLAEARRFGEMIGRAITQGESFEALDFRTKLAIYEG
ncbi:flavodoxin family protein [Candidatus Electrothrix sp.]|uniref:flavodoxin family protein n=1 Tax=Candidatus Electrothrix sp. TaxID=2170559 RepID=UPI0040569BA6